MADIMRETMMALHKKRAKQQTEFASKEIIIRELAEKCVREACSVGAIDGDLAVIKQEIARVLLQHVLLSDSRMSSPNTSHRESQTTYIIGKFDHFIHAIRSHKEIMLDLTDFGIQEDQVVDLVRAINANEIIRIVSLRHNNLNDRTAEQLAKLKWVITLDVSHNDFTEHGLSLIRNNLAVRPNFKLLDECNNTGHQVLSCRLSNN